jgi:hypothetical protein
VAIVYEVGTRKRLNPAWFSSTAVFYFEMCIATENSDYPVIGYMRSAATHATIGTVTTDVEPIVTVAGTRLTTVRSTPITLEVGEQEYYFEVTSATAEVLVYWQQSDILVEVS